MHIPLRIESIIRTSPKAVQLRLPSGKEIWFPFRHCPDLQGLSVHQKGWFQCPLWLIEREQLETDAKASSQDIVLNGTISQSTRESAFVQLQGGEEIWLAFKECPGLSHIPVGASGPFRCNSYTLGQKGLTHYALPLPQLAQAVEHGSLSLSQTILTGRIPERALHLYSCDNAQKVLHFSSQMHTDIMLSLWRAVQLKQQWLVQGTQWEELATERKRVYDMWDNVPRHHLNAIAAVWKATQFDPRQAAVGTSHHLKVGTLAPTVSTNELRQGALTPDTKELLEERQWQCHQLATRIRDTLPREANRHAG